jgi:hypothetical protein
MNFIASVLVALSLIAPMPRDFCGNHHALCPPPPCANAAYAKMHPNECPVT